MFTKTAKVDKMSVVINEQGKISNTKLVNREKAAEAFGEVVKRKCPCPHSKGCAFGLAGCHACISNHLDVGDLPACCLPQIEIVVKRDWRSPWAWVVCLLNSMNGFDELPEELQNIVTKAIEIGYSKL